VFGKEMNIGKGQTKVYMAPHISSYLKH